MSVPLTMTGRLEACVLLGISAPMEQMPHLDVPAPFSLVTHNGRGFWNIVICRVHRMRPIGVPESLGVTYHHVAYRLYVTVETVDGPLSGLYFVHSQADNRLISWGGNVTSDFKFHSARLTLEEDGDVYSAEGRSYVSSVADAFTLQGHCETGPPVPQSDLFQDRDEALQFLKYQPLGLAIGRNGDLHIAEVVRNEAEWRERQFTVREMQWDLLPALGQTDTRLELASWVDPIEYRWRIGRSTLLRR